MNDQSSTGKKPRGVARLFVLLIAVELVLLAFWWYTSYYWTLPVWAIIGYIVLGLGTAGLFVLVVSKSKRRLLGLLITTLLVAVVAVAFMLASIAFPSQWLPAEDRVAQISEDAGFAVLVPEGVELPAKSRDGYQPSADLTEDGVVTIQYRGFDVSERASDSIKTAAELEEYVELLQPEAGSDVTLEVSEAETLEVLGRPAIALTWSEVVGPKGAQPPRSILIFQPEGVIVRIESTPDAALTTGDLVTMAESMKPVK